MSHWTFHRESNLSEPVIRPDGLWLGLWAMKDLGNYYIIKCFILWSIQPEDRQIKSNQIKSYSYSATSCYLTCRGRSNPHRIECWLLFFFPTAPSRHVRNVSDVPLVTSFICAAHPCESAGWFVVNKKSALFIVNTTSRQAESLRQTFWITSLSSS